MRLIDALLCCAFCSVVEGPDDGYCSGVEGQIDADQLYSVVVWFYIEQEAGDFRKALNDALLARHNGLYGEEKFRVIDALLSCVRCSVVEGPIGARQLYRVMVLFKTEQEAERFRKALNEILLAQYNARYRKETLGSMQ
jgi:hypothetical protein